MHLDGLCRNMHPNRCDLRFPGLQHAVYLENQRVKIVAHRATVTTDYELKIEITESEIEVPCQYNQMLPNGSTAW